MTDFTEIARGLDFPEGPIWMPDGTILLVEIKGQALTRVFPDGSKEVIAQTGGGPNGAALGPDGKVYICNNGGFVWHESDSGTFPGEQPPDYRGGCIQRVDLDTGAVEDIYTECNGHPLRGPNDIVFDAAGNFWFTDLGKNRARETDKGGLYYAAPDGSMIKEVVYPLVTPNGVGLSPDGSRVYAAETIPGRAWYWDLAGPGEIQTVPGYRSNGNLLVGLPGLQLFDSLAVDSEGWVCIATIRNGGITAISPDGATVEHYPLPDFLTTNICFGGPDLATAYVTLSSTGRLVAFPWKRPGLPLHFHGV